jgi:hypothetical protein
MIGFPFSGRVQLITGRPLKFESDRVEVPLAEESVSDLPANLYCF